MAMAKQKGTTDQAGRVKIRLIEFEVEGSDSTMQESLRSITAALNRSIAPPPSPPRMKYLQAPSAAPDDESDAGQEADDEAAAADEDSGVVDTSKKPTAPRKPPTMKLLDKINFIDVSPTLKDFVAEKAPQTDLSRYLVIAYWFKHHRGTPDLTPDHFFTAYRHLQWTVPADPGAPIRDLRHKRRTQLSKGSTHGTSTINHVGENIVMGMGKGKGE